MSNYTCNICYGLKENCKNVIRENLITFLIGYNRKRDKKYFRKEIWGEILNLLIV